MTSTDFRKYSFNITRITDSGKYIGRRVYWRLYLLENIVRIVVNSVLSVQINPNWWSVAASPNLLLKIQDRRNSYLLAPHLTSPGLHDIYFIFIYELNNIIARYRSSFLPVMPDIDNWISDLENVKYSRNIVAHMNWPNQYDINLVDRMYDDAVKLALDLQVRGIPLLTP